jgi:hypothetical protein
LFPKEILFAYRNSKGPGHGLVFLQAVPPGHSSVVYQMCLFLFPKEILFEYRNSKGPGHGRVFLQAVPPGHSSVVYLMSFFFVRGFYPALDHVGHLPVLVAICRTSFVHVCTLTVQYLPVLLLFLSRFFCNVDFSIARFVCFGQWVFHLFRRSHPNSDHTRSTPG